VNATITSFPLLERSERSPEPVDVYLLRPIRSKTEYAAHDLGDDLKDLQPNRSSNVS
jgi:hypothetical protein